LPVACGGPPVRGGVRGEGDAPAGRGRGAALRARAGGRLRAGAGPPPSSAPALHLGRGGRHRRAGDAARARRDAGRRLAEHGALSPSLVAQLLRQLLDALATMHAAQWVHRDVKPANLLLDATGEEAPHLLLADFGIALHESDVRLTETGFAHGTPGFMAPEVLAGAGTSTAQDVWAAAACALE